MSSSVAPGGPFTLKGLMNETSLRNLKYTNMFTQMDGDGDGLINAEELRAGLVKLGVKKNKTQVTQLLLQFNQGQATHTFHRARYAVYGVCICRPPARDTRTRTDRHTHSLYTQPGPFRRMHSSGEASMAQPNFIDLAKHVQYEMTFDVGADGELSPLERTLMKYDTDKSGQFSVAEVKAVVDDLQKEQKQVGRAAP